MRGEGWKCGSVQVTGMRCEGVCTGYGWGLGEGLHNCRNPTLCVGLKGMG